MSAQPGALSRVYFNRETAAGTEAALIVTNGGRMYFDRCRGRGPRSRQPFDQIDGSASAFQVKDYTPGTPNVSMTLAFAKTYSGIHAIMDGMALGSLTTAASTPNPFIHTAQPSNYSWPFTFWHVFAMDDPATFNQDILTGMKCTRCRWSHRVNDFVRQEMEFVGMAYEYDETVPADSALPGYSGTGYKPDEPAINWDDIAVGQDIGITIEGAGSFDLRCRSWEITVENPHEQSYVISDSKAATEPERSGDQVITGRMEIEADIGYQNIADLYGYLRDDEMKQFQVFIWYQNKTDNDYELEFIVYNCRLTDRGGGTEGKGKQTQQIEFHAVSEAPTTQSMQIVTKNKLEKPSTASVWDGYDSPLAATYPPT